MRSLKELEETLKIDKYTLDDDNLRSPQLMWEATQGLATANRQHANLEQEVKDVYAALDQQFRAQATEAGERRSEDMLKQMIANTPKLRKLKAEVINAQEQVDLWEGMVESLKQRSYALKEEGELYRANYYTTETSGKDRSDYKTAEADRIRKRVAEEGKRRRN